MSTREKPACLDVRTFLRANGHDLGALTGQDARALSAIAHCWELYAALHYGTEPSQRVSTCTTEATRVGGVSIGE